MSALGYMKLLFMLTALAFLMFPQVLLPRLHLTGRLDSARKG